MIDRIRIRRIIQLAAKNAPSAREWLTRDEQGTWEREVVRLLNVVAEKPNAAEFSEKQVDKEVAVVVGLLALEALVQHARKKTRR